MMMRSKDVMRARMPPMHETQGYETVHYELGYQAGYSAGHAEGVKGGKRDEYGRIRRVMIDVRDLQAIRGFRDVVAILDGLIDGLEVRDE